MSSAVEPPYPQGAQYPQERTDRQETQAAHPGRQARALPAASSAAAVPPDEIDGEEADGRTASRATLNGVTGQPGGYQAPATGYPAHPGGGPGGAGWFNQGDEGQPGYQGQQAGYETQQAGYETQQPGDPGHPGGRRR